MASGSADISVTAEIRILRDRVASDISALREDILSGLSNISIPIGQRIAESIEAEAPRIQRGVADAVAAGAAQGAASIATAIGGALAVTSGRASFHESDLASVGGMNASGYYQGYGMRGLPHYGGNRGGWGGEDGYDFEGEVVGSQRLLSGPPGSMGSEGDGGAKWGGWNNGGRLPAGFDMNQGESMNVLGGMNRLFSAFMLIRGVREAEEFYVKNADLTDKEFSAENMPERSDSQKIRKNRAIISTNQAEIDENEGFFGYINESIQHQGAVAGLKFYELDQGARQKKIEDAQTSLSNAEGNQDQQKENRLRLENELTKAQIDGNEALAKHLEIQMKITDRQILMNENHVGSGDAWANSPTGGGAMFTAGDRQSAASSYEFLDSLMGKTGAARTYELAASGRTEESQKWGLAYEQANRLNTSERAFKKAGGKIGNDSEETYKNANQDTFSITDPSNLTGIQQAALDYTNTYDANQTRAKGYGEYSDIRKSAIQEQTKEIQLQSSGNEYAAQVSRIKYETAKASKADPDDASEINARGDAQLQALRPGLNFQSPMEMWKGMQHASIGANPHATHEDVNPYTPKTKAWEQWEAQKKIRDTRTAHQKSMDDRTQTQKNADYSHALGLHGAGIHDQTHIAAGQDQHGHTWHSENDFGPHDDLNRPTPLGTYALPHPSYQGGVQYGPHGEKPGGGPAYGPGDRTGHPGESMSAAKSLSDAAATLAKNALHVSIVSANV